MEQSPSWEANRSSASQEIPRVLWNPKVHYRTHKSPLRSRIIFKNECINYHNCNPMTLSLIKIKQGTMSQETSVSGNQFRPCKLRIEMPRSPRRPTNIMYRRLQSHWQALIEVSNNCTRDNLTHTLSLIHIPWSNWNSGCSQHYADTSVPYSWRNLSDMSYQYVWPWTSTHKISWKLV
jgi:hypothetical protein